MVDICISCRTRDNSKATLFQQAGLPAHLCALPHSTTPSSHAMHPSSTERSKPQLKEQETLSFSLHRHPEPTAALHTLSIRLQQAAIVAFALAAQSCVTYLTIHGFFVVGPYRSHISLWQAIATEGLNVGNAVQAMVLLAMPVVMAGSLVYMVSSVWRKLEEDLVARVRLS
ncbi:unnamed protein product [Peniophora sp. CBMAI 1063]|nr:unnamed protein product [Peniophora sp. CBMAI 1063]